MKQEMKTFDHGVVRASTCPPLKETNASQRPKLSVPAIPLTQRSHICPDELRDDEALMARKIILLMNTSVF